MLGDIGRGTAILAAQRQALQQPQADQDRGCRDSPILSRGGQEADYEGGKAHDRDGDEEGVLASDQVADAAEDQRAERTDQEARGEGEQGEDVAGGLVELGEELGADDDGKGAVEVEVVPFEHRAQRGGDDHLAFLAEIGRTA